MKIEEGGGWRLVVDPDRVPFPVLLGGAHWAAEFTPAEALALRDGIQRLVDQHRQVRHSLMAEEAISLELELVLQEEDGQRTDAVQTPLGRGTLWLSLEGDRNLWEIRFILTPADRARRALEGGWPAGASAALAEVVRRIAFDDPGLAEGENGRRETV